MSPSGGITARKTRKTRDSHLLLTPRIGFCMIRVMPRVARVVVPGVPHHVTQRGNNRQDVFFVDDDRRVYLAMLGEQCRRYGVTILGYCLMGNHVHLITVPARADWLAKAIGRTHGLYAQYVKRRYRASP